MLLRLVCFGSVARGVNTRSGILRVGWRSGRMLRSLLGGMFSLGLGSFGGVRDPGLFPVLRVRRVLAIRLTSRR